MMWLGVAAGLFLGAAFESFKAALMLAILGGVAGHALARRNAQQMNERLSSSYDPSIVANLDIQVERLTEQVRRLTQRLHLVEQQLQTGAAALPASREQTVDPTPATEPPDQESLGLEQSVFDADASNRQDDLLDASAVPAALNANADSATQTVAGPEPSSAQAAEPAIETTPSASFSGNEAVSPQTPHQASPGKPSPSQRPPASVEPSWLASIIQRWVIGGNPLLKIGVLILFLGLAFLLRYVAEHTVVPVELRYAGVAATGIALLLFGWRWRVRADNYGLILQGAGIGVLYLTTLAAMKLHPLIPVELGFGVLFAVAVFAAMLAILQDSLALAVIATLGGFAAPILTSTGRPHHVAFFTYLAVINLGIVLIAWFKAWRVLNLIGFVCTFALACLWGRQYYRPEMWQTCEPFLLLLFVMYVLITFLFARRTLAEAPEADDAGFEQHAVAAASQIAYVDGTLAFGVPFASFFMQYLLVRQFEYGAAFSALGFGLAYVVLAFALFRGSGMRYALLSETMIALAVVFGSLAIPLGLEERWTSAAWAVEAAGVYWVGIRQLRVHARLFALLLLFGSAVYFAMGVHVDGANGEVLDGSLLGSGMLALSSWWMYRLLRLAQADDLHRFEIALRSWLIAAGAFFLALMPFMLWPMNWASTALALLATLAVFAGQYLSERPLLNWGWLYQAAAGALFMTTLHLNPGGSVLANGWTGLLAASLIGASMLAGVWAMTRQSLKNASAAGDGAHTAEFSKVASLGLLAGLVFINLAPLFVLPWRFAAMIWPLTGIATLWWAVRVRHAGALAFALALQLVAGLAHFGSRLFLHEGAVDLLTEKPFMHTGFWGPLLIALAAFICARLLHKKAVQASDASLGWIALFWASAWWSFAWADEILRVAQADLVSACLVGAAIVTGWLWSSAARRLDWPQLGLATLAYLPALIVLLAAEWLSPVQHPLSGWGALAWPLALLMHGLLLRRQDAWVPGTALGLAHTVGAWFFVTLTAIELRWQFAHWANAESAWPLLGWMIAPVIYLWSLTSRRIKNIWPLRDHREAYLVASAIPMVVYLLAWVWITNAISEGTATPLPYLPLLNPLEIAQVAVLLGIAIWWWSLSEHALFRDNKPAAIAVTGASAFAILTGSVVRSCHHFGHVAWQPDALITSNLVQTSLSVVWSIVAIGLMMAGNRNRQRWIWIIGACLIAVVVAKLFLVELAATGSLARIVSFIVVGVLLLLVGYFAPLPPKKKATPPASA
jgi:uncharacterized membrane protein